MGHSVGKMLAKERRHNETIRTLDDNDHATQRAGGRPTHGKETNFKTIETGAKDKTQTPLNGMRETVRAATGRGASPSGPSPSDVDGNW